MLSAPFTVAAIARGLERLRGKKSLGVEILARGLVKALGLGKRHRLAEVERVIASNGRWEKLTLKLASLSEFTDLSAPRMLPASGAPQRWKVPALRTLTELTDWLGLDLDCLHWLSASWRGDHEAAGKFSHYRYRWLPRAGRAPRLVEAPLPKLKTVQRRILSGILSQIPVHPNAHGFVSGRSVVSFAAPHTEQQCVLKLDLQDFFPSIGRARVLRVFLTAGYPETVAACLADLCTVSTPAAVRDQGLRNSPYVLAWGLREKLRQRHLPQGAPTSPALANLCFYSMDCRLTGLAQAFGATYTRYADDLVFSGGNAFQRSVLRCENYVVEILAEERLSLAHRKTRVMKQSVRQQVAGVVVNQKPNCPRNEREQLKAILTNCARFGPASQNRSDHLDFRAHLQGRVAHVSHLNPQQGAKLRALFAAIVWD